MPLDSLIIDGIAMYFHGATELGILPYRRLQCVKRHEGMPGFAAGRNDCRDKMLGNMLLSRSLPKTA